MSGKCFVDTNILLYAHDRDAGRKHAIASEILRQLWQEQNGVLSMQVLQEFYVNATRKMARPLSTAEARATCEDFVRWSIAPSVNDILSAFHWEEQVRINFWDAMIVAAAARSGAERLLTEDLNHNQSIAGMLVVNPFL